MAKIYFTLTGCSHYLGTDFLEKGTVVKLKKEPDNQYDSEAIMVKIKGLGKIGYVANSPYTVHGESMSAGRLYDRIGKKAKGKVIAVIPGYGAICKIIEKEPTSKLLDEEIIMADPIPEDEKLSFN